MILLTKEEKKIHNKQKVIYAKRDLLLMMATKNTLK